MDIITFYNQKSDVELTKLVQDIFLTPDVGIYPTIKDTAKNLLDKPHTREDLIVFLCNNIGNAQIEGIKRI